MKDYLDESEMNSLPSVEPVTQEELEAEERQRELVDNRWALYTVGTATLLVGLTASS